MKPAAKIAAKKSLLDEDDSSSSSESSASESSAQDTRTQLTVNRKYARAFQERKQLEELQRVRDREEDIGSDDSSSEEEDDDGRLLTSSVNLKFLKLMKALKKKDDTLYDKSARFFDEEVPDETEEKGGKKDKVKKVKDVLREQILEQMDEDVADKSEDREPAQSKFAYDAQQDEIRKSFLKSAGGGDDDESDDDKEDWMVIKSRKEPSLEEKEALTHLEEIEEITKKQSDKTIDPRGEIKDGDKFLIDFLKQKKWIDKDGDFGADDDSIDDLDKADDYEANYNFRFEQAEAEATSGATLSVQTYARGNTMTTVRRADTARKEKRESRKERKAAERKAKEEQLKRLKNAKRQEANKKLAQIKSVLGSVDQEAVDEAVIMKMLEGDYDPEQFEKAMNAAFGDDFYEKEDQEWKTDLDVREGLKGDEDGEAIVGDDVEGGMYDTKAAEEEEEDEEEYDDTEGDQQAWGGDEAMAEGEEDDTPETELEKKVKTKMQEELYKLDYEDIVAGMPTRFKYRQVPKNDFGLSTHEILLARDSNLKQFVSLKKMAPYTEEGEHHVGSKKRRRFREALKSDLEELEAQERDVMEENEAEEQNEAESAEEPKKKKRRRLKKGKKRDNGSTPAETENTETTEPHVTPEKESTKKRRRKKKGKKGISSDSNPQDDSEKIEESTEDRQPSENIAADEKKIKTPGSSEDKKRRKKKKQRKKEAMGLSASRLSSYGL